MAPWTKALVAEGFHAIATADDFLKRVAPPEPDVNAIVTNPPYGDDRRGLLACAFIRHALTLDVRHGGDVAEGRFRFRQDAS